jgi:hypothetical protein
MRALVAFFAVLLCSCATDTQVVGPYAARLSAADIEQIRVLAAADLTRLHQHPTGPPRRLDVVRPDYVRVDMPIRDPYADTCSFDVMKRHGHWIVDGHGGGVGGLARGENVIVY